MKKLAKSAPKKAGDSDKILEVSLVSGSMMEVIRSIEKRLSNQQKTFITTPNPEFLVFTQENPWFKQILDKADLAIPDGIALVWAKEVIKGKNFFNRLAIGFVTGFRIIFQGWGEKRVTGTDLTEKLCQLAAEKNWTVYFLGGKGDAAILAFKNLQKKYPNLKGWTAVGPNLEIKDGKWIKGQMDVNKTLIDINKKQPDLLFVAFGMGKQEKFIADNWRQLKVKLAIGVGGAFDYFSGKVKRAPQWVMRSGFEWLYRLIEEPWRWKRQLKLLTFIWLILKGR